MVSAKSLVPNWLPRLVTPAGVDQASVLRGLRSDAKGGVFAGYAGSISSVVRESVWTTFPSGGTVEIHSSAVANNYMHVYQVIAAYHSDPTARTSSLSLFDGSSSHTLNTSALLPSHTPFTITHDVILVSGEYISFRVYGLTAEEWLNLCVVGYKVALQ